jgi:hypothetical protein
MARSLVAVLACVVSLVLESPSAQGREPEDFLKGQIILSDKDLPMEWKSVRAYVRKLKRLRRKAIAFDGKGKVRLHYAAFFAKPVRDVQVDMVVYDITEGERLKKTSWETFLAKRGDRAVFSNVDLTEEDLPGDRKYQFVVAHRGRALAKGELRLLAPRRGVRPVEVEFGK